MRFEREEWRFHVQSCALGVGDALRGGGAAVRALEEKEEEVKTDEFNGFAFVERRSGGGESERSEVGGAAGEESALG